MVPESECSTPTLIGSAQSAAAMAALPNTAAVTYEENFSVIGRSSLLSLREARAAHRALSKGGPTGVSQVPQQ